MRRDGEIQHNRAYAVCAAWRCHGGGLANAKLSPQHSKLTIVCILFTKLIDQVEFRSPPAVYVSCGHFCERDHRPCVRSCNSTPTRSKQCLCSKKTTQCLTVSANGKMLYANHARSFTAQRCVQKFSAHATRSILRHRVAVHHQVKNQEYTSASRSQNVIAIDWGERIHMTWQQFLRKYTIWFAATVLAVPSLEGMNPFADAPTLGLDNIPVDLEQLQTAINAVNNIPDVDTFDNLYYDYIKRGDVTDLGYYSKDNWPLPMAIEVRTEVM